MYNANHHNFVILVAICFTDKQNYDRCICSLCVKAVYGMLEDEDCHDVEKKLKN